MRWCAPRVPLRLLGALVLLLGLVAVPAAAGRAAGVTGPAVPATGARCRSATPVTAAGYARALAALPQGGDASLSVRLRSGRVAWIFADTLGPRIGLLHSTVVMQSHGCFRATGRALLPDDRGGRYWWPTAAAVLPGGPVLVVATDGYGGRARAAVCVEAAGVLRFARWLPAWPQPGRSGVHWYAGLLVDGPVLWVYGVRSAATRWVFDRELWTASVPLRDLSSGRGWHLATRPVAPASVLGVDNAVAAYRDRRGYHLVTIQGGPFGQGPLVRLDAPRPGGPFTRHVLVARLLPRPGQWRYNAAVHPGNRLRDGRLLVTVNNNWPLGTRRIGPLASYRPSFLAVAR